MKHLAWALKAALTFALVSGFPQPASANLAHPLAQVSSKIMNEFRKFTTSNAASAPILDSYDNLLKYTLGLKGVVKCENQQLVAFERLKSEMISKGLQNTVQVIQFYSSLVTAIAQVDTKTRASLEAIRKATQLYVDRKVKKWAVAIASNSQTSYLDAVELSKRHPKSLQSIISSLISQAYGGRLERVTQCLRFLKSLKNLENQAFGLYHLTYNMYRLGHFDNAEVFQLAYRLKQVFGDARFSGLPAGTKSLLNWARNVLPKNVREIVLKGTNCRVKNDDFKTYLYADSETRDSSRRYDFLWYRPRQSKTGDRWSFETSDEGRTWNIKNDHYKGYLIAESSSYNSHSHRRWTFVSRSPQRRRSDGKWNLSIIPDGGKHVAFRNVHRNKEYMYADGKYVKDSRRRTVYTWERGQPRGKMWLESKWDVICN